MAEKRIFVENDLGVNVLNPVTSVTIQEPLDVTIVPDVSLIGLYTFSVHDLPGVLAPNTYVSIFNPLASGRNVQLTSTTVSAYVTAGGNTTKASLLLTRTTAASGGVLQAVSAINKGRTSFPNPVAEIRTGNPTVTLGAEIVAFPPPIGTDTATINDRIVAVNGGAIVLVPGEGAVYRMTAGDTDENFNIAFTWSEV